MNRRGPVFLVGLPQAKRAYRIAAMNPGEGISGGAWRRPVSRGRWLADRGRGVFRWDAKASPPGYRQHRDSKRPSIEFLHEDINPEFSQDASRAANRACDPHARDAKR